MNFLNNMSKTTSDVIGAIIGVTIFWFSIQFFIGDDLHNEGKNLIVQDKEIVNPLNP